MTASSIMPPSCSFHLISWIWSFSRVSRDCNRLWQYREVKHKLTKAFVCPNQLVWRSEKKITQSSARSADHHQLLPPFFGQSSSRPSPWPTHSLALKARNVCKIRYSVAQQKYQSSRLVYICCCFSEKGSKGRFFAPDKLYNHTCKRKGKEK